MPQPPDTLAARLRFRHLKLLVELRRCGTLGKAAAGLHLTQPALSKMLREVEDAFGVTIFERGPRGLAPTARGQAILHGAEVLLAELHQLGQLAHEPDVTPAPVLRLGAPPAVAAGGILPQVMARLRSGQARLVVHLREEAVPRLFDELVAGELDALLTSYNQAAFAAKRPAPLVYEPCGQHGYAVIGPGGHPFARRRKLGWAELAGERWIMPAPELLSRQALDGQFLRAGAAPPAPWIVSDSPATNVQLVAAGLGVAAVPAAMAEAERRAGRIVRLPVGMTPALVPTALVYRAAAAEHVVVAELRRAVQAASG
ncbi:MAG TPA: LysR family transcriptional regulator [Ramlibacter sp.]|nr:LysR family transcriptional regulator [Ramlibacter sp.]